jgi:lipoate-protein ligase A
VGKNQQILLFYQNENAVIIGKNQNPWIECDLETMKKDGVELARRVSGGGAVYHDAGNLNFSFISGEDRTDREEVLDLILNAIKSLGIECEFSGRNDLLASGRKFSGNAFAVRHGKKICHGTLLVSSDLDRLSSYLTVDSKKILSKGISSVRRRVCNLSEFQPEITVKDLKKAILKAYEEKGGYYADFAFSEREEREVEEYHARHKSPEWCLGQTPKFDLEWSDRLSFGSLSLHFSFEKGMISAIKAYSDAMEPTLCDRIEEALIGIPFENTSISAALSASNHPNLIELSEKKFL